jgi:tRNA uridine 5-carboxymethylaminomethyl modification enzyme
MLLKIIWSRNLEQAETSEVFWLYWKERNNADKLTRLEDVKIPADFDYDKIKSMSIEAKQKLSKDTSCYYFSSFKN